MINNKGVIFMHKMNIIIVLTLQFFIATTVNANSNWLYIGDSIEDIRFFIDKNSMQSSGNSVTFWQRLNYP